MKIVSVLFLSMMGSAMAELKEPQALILHVNCYQNDYKNLLRKKSRALMARSFDKKVSGFDFIGRSDKEKPLEMCADSTVKRFDIMGAGPSRLPQAFKLTGLNLFVRQSKNYCPFDKSLVFENKFLSEKVHFTEIDFASLSFQKEQKYTLNYTYSQCPPEAVNRLDIEGSLVVDVLDRCSSGPMAVASREVSFSQQAIEPVFDGVNRYCKESLIF